jgi:hypothetical protein
MTSERLALGGTLTVRVVDKRGRQRACVVQDNEIVNVGRTLIGQLLVGGAGAVPISHLAVGTSGTAPTLADTQLGAEIASIDRAPIEVTPLSGVIGLRVSAQVSSATTQAVAEAGLFNASGHGSGTMYNRVAFPSPLPVATDLDLFFEWDITF